MFSVTPLGEEGVYLINEDHSWLVAASHGKQCSHHLLSLTNLVGNGWGSSDYDLLLALLHIHDLYTGYGGLSAAPTHFEVSEEALMLKNVACT